MQGGGGGAAHVPVHIDHTDSPYSVAAGVTLYCDCTTADIIANLPTAVGNGGKQIVFKRVDTTMNEVTVNRFGSELVELDTSMIIEGGGPVLAAVTLESDDVNWYWIA